MGRSFGSIRCDQALSACKLLDQTCRRRRAVVRGKPTSQLTGAYGEARLAEHARNHPPEGTGMEQPFAQAETRSRPPESCPVLGHVTAERDRDRRAAARERPHERAVPPVADHDIGELIRAVNAEGVTVLLVDHNVRLVTEVCHRVIVLDWGKVLTVAGPTEVWQDERVKTAYLGTNKRLRSEASDAGS